MEIGLFFGTFNPIHHGHLMIANFLLNQTHLKKIWFIPSPQNPFKINQSIANIYDRIEMIRLSIEEEPNFQISDIETKMPIPSYTIDTLTYLKEQFPQHSFNLIMGSDNLNGFHKWKNFAKILENFKIIIYPRDNEIPEDYLNHPNIQFTKAPKMEISSNQVRDFQKNKKSIRYFVPDKVMEFIDAKGLYR